MQCLRARAGVVLAIRILQVGSYIRCVLSTDRYNADAADPAFSMKSPRCHRKMDLDRGSMSLRPSTRRFNNSILELAAKGNSALEQWEAINRGMIR